MKKEKIFEKTDNGIDSGEKKILTLYNDDYHTFDYVIDALQKVCKHNPEQAIQCTYLVHFKGKCEVKSGDFDFLKPMKEELCILGLEAAIS
jgi:ATP-dependent Clp protease adaptor protein ClpS